MKIIVDISIPYLWGNEKFKKDEWGHINLLVGANGSGKTVFAEQLKQQCQNQGLKTRYLNAERLTGLEKQNYPNYIHSRTERGLDIAKFAQYKNEGIQLGLSSDAFIILKEKIDIRIKIEATLSQLFKRRIRLAEEGGFLRPKMQKIHGGNEYGLKENECHGLKEIITLLTFIYDDEFNCLILDEPELHLHPQFQTLFLQEIRKIAGDPEIDSQKKCFFLITHSPYYIDIRTINDLKNCIIFQPDKLPTYVDYLENEDERRIRRLLPRLNTHHKQFFFAPHPIFVEGYTDQQLFSQIQEMNKKSLGSSETCIIDVGGKDELDVFFRLCNNLEIDARFITDLDTIFRGKLRQSVSNDEQCKNYLQTEGLGVDLMSQIGEVEHMIGECLKELELKLDSMVPINSNLKLFHESLKSSKETHIKRCIFVIGLKNIRQEIETNIPNQVGKLTLIEGKLQKISEGFKKCGVFVLPNGELENYLPNSIGNPYLIKDENKTKIFEQERDFILKNDSNIGQINLRYADLITILDEASSSNTVNLDSHLSYIISDWIHKVQLAFNRGEISDIQSLETNAIIDWATHSRIFELLEFNSDSSVFNCKIKLKQLVDSKEREIVFNDEIVAAKYKLY